MNRWIVRSLVLGILAILLLVGLKQEARAQQGQDQGPGLDQSSDLTSYHGLDVFPHLEGGEPAPNAQVAQNTNVYAPYSAFTFQSARDMHDWEIIVGDYSGGNQIRLTWNEVADIHPRLNRGCTKIVYASFQPSKNYNIFTMNSDGSGVTQLTGNNKDDVFPAWSPDGTKIAFQAYRDGNPEIYIMNADGSNQTRLTASTGFDGTPAWSPDGRIVFASNRGGADGIWVMNADGSGLTQLTWQANSTLPAWSPDGSQIAYSADSNGDGWMELWLMNADGSNQHMLISYGSPYDALARSWSPDGHYIAFTKVGWVNYHGNWYWTFAYLTAWDTQTHYVEEITPDDTEWYPDWQTSDGQPPVSSMTPLTSQSPATFLVSWSGYDNGPSGLKNFDVQVKDGIDGAWMEWLMATTRTSASYYLGVGGHTYYFRVRARDNAWNL
jgi:Tol biopolymer transport system component